MITIPDTTNGPVLPKVPLTSNMNWQNPAGRGPYQTLSKSNPEATNEYVAN